jgi:hypothetical protein
MSGLLLVKDARQPAYVLGVHPSCDLDHRMRRNATEQPAFRVDDRRRCDAVSAGQHHQLVLAEMAARSRRIRLHDFLEPGVFSSGKEANQGNEPDEASACIQHVNMLETVEPPTKEPVDCLPDRRVRQGRGHGSDAVATCGPGQLSWLGLAVSILIDSAVLVRTPQAVPRSIMHRIPPIMQALTSFE